MIEEKILEQFFTACTKMTKEAVEDKPSLPRPPVFLGVDATGTIAGIQIGNIDRSEQGMNNVARRLFSRLPTIVAVAMIEGTMWRHPEIDEQDCMKITMITDNFKMIRRLLVFSVTSSGIRWWDDNKELQRINREWMEEPKKQMSTYDDLTKTKADKLLKSLLFGYLFYKFLHSIEDKIKSSKSVSEKV